MFYFMFYCLFGFQVGAPPEIASLLDEIRRESELCQRSAVVSTSVVADPELDDFMVCLFSNGPKTLANKVSITHALSLSLYLLLAQKP